MYRACSTYSEFSLVPRRFLVQSKCYQLIQCYAVHADQLQIERAGDEGEGGGLQEGSLSNFLTGLGMA